MNRKPLLAGVWALALLAAGATAAHGQTTYTWNGGGADANWSTSANWGGATLVSSATDTFIVLAGNTRPVNVLDLAPGGIFDVNRLTLAAGAAAFTVNASGAPTTTLRIGNGGITQLSTNGLTLAAPLALSAAQTWATNAGGALTVSGTVNLGANTLTLGGTGSGAINVGGVISGTGGITKAGTGSGVATLSGANTYTGATTISSGTLATTTLANGGAASGIGQSTNAAGNLVLNGGTLRYTGAAASTDRLFTLGLAGTLEANGTGAVNFNNAGGIAFTGTGTRTLTLGGTNAGANTLASIIGNDASGSTSLVKNGAGTWVLTGANTYAGGTTINGGVLQFNSAAAIGGTGANVTVNAGGAAAAGFAIDQAFLGRIVSTSQGSVALGVNSANNLDFSAAGANLTAASLGAAAGATVSYTGVLTPNGDTYRLGGGGGTLTLPNVLANVGGPTNLQVAGPTGTVVLTGTNTYSGTTTVSGGTLAVGNLAAAGTASNVGPGELILNGGTLQFTGASTNRLFSLGTAGGSVNSSGAAPVTFANAGPLTFAGSGPRTLTLTGTNAGTNLFNPVIGDGPGGPTSVAKTGTGTWVVPTPNTYTGTTTVSQGVLGINRPTVGATPVGTGAINLGGGTVSFRGTAANPLTVTGFNQDVISSFNDIASPNPFGTTTAIDNAPGVAGGWVFMENRPDFLAAFGLPTTLGLPASRQFVSAANPLTTYRLAAYDNGTGGGISNNALFLSADADSTNTGSLNLAAASQGRFQTVSALVTGGGGATGFNATLRFSDGTTRTITGLSAPDWFNNNPFAITNLGRMERQDGEPDLQGAITNPGNPRMYPVDFHLTDAEQLKTLVGVDFARTGGGRLSIFGLSGAGVGGANTYANGVNVTANSTIEMLNTGFLTLGPLSIGGQTLTTTAFGNTSLTFQSTTLSGNPTFNVAANQTFTTGAIDYASAARTITKNGAGILVLGNAAVNATGTNQLTANAGTVNVTNATALGTNPNLLVAGATANLGPYTTLNNVTVNGGTANLPSVTAAATATIGGGTANFGSAVSIPTATIGGGTTNFAAGASLGTATVNGGTTNIGAASTAARLGGTGGTIALGANTLTVGGANQNDAFAGVFTGAGAVTKVGTGTQTLSGAGSTFTGGVNVNVGRVTATRPGTLGTGTVTLQNGTTLGVGGTAGATILGFGGSGTGWTLNGGPTVTGDVLTLTTNANNQTRSAFFNTKQPTTAFTASFDYLRGAGSGNPADGFTFAIQNQAATALGGGGGGLGYTGLTSVRGLAVNIYNPNGRGISVRTDGTLPGGGGYTATTPVDIFNGTVRFNLAYDGTNLNVSLTQGANTFNLPSVAWNLSGIGADAWVGFTGATGGENAFQTISNFVFNRTGGPAPAPLSTYTNAVSVAAGASATISPMVSADVTSFAMGNLTAGSGSTLNVQADTGAPANTAYALTLGATTLTGAVTFNVANNGTGVGTLTLGALNDGGTARTITKAGAGTLALGGAATSLVTGTAVNVDGGTLRVANATALGTLANVTVAPAATLSLGAAQTVGALNGAGNVALNGNTLTVGSGNNLNSTFGGVIANGTAAGGVTKAGAGVVTLTGANTYTGPTAVNAGTLRVNGSVAGAVTVGSGARIGGTGTIGGPLAVGAGATLDAGASVGTLTVANSVTVNGGTGSNWVVELNGNGTSFPPPADTPNDRVALTGSSSNLNLVVSSANRLNISVQAIDGYTPPLNRMSYTIATTQAGGSIQVNGAPFAFDPNHYTFDAVGFLGASDFQLAVSGNSLVLTFTPVPEPGAVLGLSAAALGLVVWTRRRFRNFARAGQVA